MRLREAPAESPHGHGGEVFALAFTPDGTHVLSGGWDGRLCLWDADTGQPVVSLVTGPKPVSACAVSPDGRKWLSGTLEGVLGVWDAADHKCLRRQVVHTRPISTIRFSDDGKTLVTASWDRRVTVWDPEKEGDSTPLAGHDDIVAGCCFTPDGSRLVSWSYDGTVRFWQVAPPLDLAPLPAHGDRVTAGAVSPDGRWLATGARDGEVKLWDLTTNEPVAATRMPGEVRALAFFLDGETLLGADLSGGVAVYQLPDLTGLSGLATGLTIHCAEMDRSNTRVVLGCSDGRVHFMDVEGFESPLLVTPTRKARRTATPLQRLLGRSTVKVAYEVTCPVCRLSFDVPRATPGTDAACPSCRRPLRFNSVTRVPAEEPV